MPSHHVPRHSDIPVPSYIYIPSAPIYHFACYLFPVPSPWVPRHHHSLSFIHLTYPVCRHLWSLGIPFKLLSFQHLHLRSLSAKPHISYWTSICFRPWSLSYGVHLSPLKCLYILSLSTEYIISSSHMPSLIVPRHWALIPNIIITSFQTFTLSHDISKKHVCTLHTQTYNISIS